jgi:GST-like protein
MKNGFPYAALRRFDNETHRIYGVMNPGLFNKRYLAAGQYTIANMICYPRASQTHSWRDTDSNLRASVVQF